MQSSKIPLPQSFIAKKKIILNQLSVPISEYDDLSPKGSVDEGIRDLIDEINRIEGCVTTSSCSGRVSVFLEGKKQVHGEELDGSLREGSESGARETTAGVGGKGGGGRWLYVSHNEVDITQHDGAEGSLTGLLGMEQSHDGLRLGAGIRFIHFKFEPMILHTLTASFEHAQIILSAALQAGFRESGAINLTSSSKEPPTPMVAVRSMGLAFESLVGFDINGKQMCSVSEGTLRTLLEVSNDRFQANAARIARFRELLRQSKISGSGAKKRDDNKDWEDPEVRKQRKRAEGLKRKEMLSETKEDPIVDPEDAADIEFFP